MDTGVIVPRSTQQTAQAAKLKVFISYSREDLKFADQLDSALDLYGFDCTLDRQSISGGEEWQRRLGTLIRESDTVVFVLSPTSATSSVCTWEVEEAQRLGKRILPVLCRPLEASRPPPQLQNLNYIFFYDEADSPGSGFGSGLVALAGALNSDLDWIREHTRLLARATEWDSAGRKEIRLLTGTDIPAAKSWASRRPKNSPEPTALQLDFIKASEAAEEARSNAERRQLDEIAAAQAERAKALDQAEAALRQAAEAQRKRARLRNIALAAVSVVAALAGWQWYRAEQQRKAADAILGGATGLIIKVSKRGALDRDLTRNVRAIFEQGAELGNPIAMGNLGTVYENGYAVKQDFAKAYAWYAKAAEAGIANSMIALGRFHEDGKGIAQDFAKAREWYEKAVAKGDTNAMVRVGLLHEQGHGVTKNLDQAREWYEKAAAKGNLRAKINLVNLKVDEAVTGARYEEAVQLVDELLVRVEDEETKDIGRPGAETANILVRQAWRSLLVRQFAKALAAAERALAIVPTRLDAHVNKAHALMFLDRGSEAMEIYLRLKGKRLPAYSNRTWEELLAGDFVKLRHAGIAHPLMSDVEQNLGVKQN